MSEQNYLKKVVSWQNELLCEQIPALPNTHFQGELEPQLRMQRYGSPLMSKCRNQGLTTSVLFFDISGYFNNIHHHLLIHKWETKNTDNRNHLALLLPCPTKSCHVVDGKTSHQMTLDDVGVPQVPPWAPHFPALHRRPTWPLHYPNEQQTSTLQHCHWTDNVHWRRLAEGHL